VQVSTWPNLSPRRPTLGSSCLGPQGRFASSSFSTLFLVLERSLRFFKLQMGQRTDNVSTLRLKARRSPPDVAVAEPPRRGRPPNASSQPAKCQASRETGEDGGPRPTPQSLCCLPGGRRRFSAVADCAPHEPPGPFNPAAIALHQLTRYQLVKMWGWSRPR
jgi:hypothetical protein